MSNSNFDPANFLSMEVDSAFSTVFTAVPEGDYPAQIIEVIPREVATKNGDRIIVGVKWMVTDPSVAEAIGIDEPTVKQDLWIDQDDNGALSTGVNKNIALGNLRDVLNQNEPGKPWSFAHLIGGSATISVRHSITDNQRVMANVTNVSKAG